MPRELIEQNWKGELLRGDQSKNYWLEAPFSLEGKDSARAFRLTTTLIAKITKQGLPTDRELAEGTILNAIATRLAKEFARRTSWRVFHQTELDLDPAQPGEVAMERFKEVPKVEVEVVPALYEQLFNDAARIKQINQAYEKGKNKLYDLLAHHSHSLSHHATEIRTVLRFIEGCNQCSADSFMSAWYDEKTSGVKRSFDDLFGRKNPNHPGYRQAVDYARGNLYSFNAPYAYLKQPPSPHEVESYLA